MRNLLTLMYDVLAGRFTGYRRFNLRGSEYLLARPIAGGSPDPDPDPEPEPTPGPEPEPSPEPEPAPEPDPEPKPPKFEGEFDRERAERALAQAREAERKAKERAQRAEAEAAELKQAQETEQERIQRERDEARQAAQQATERANGLLIDGAIREALTAAGVLSKRVRRAAGEIDRGEITVEDDQVRGAEEAVSSLVEGFDADDREYYLGEKPESEEPDPDPEPGGGNPDRKRKPKPMSVEDARKLAKENPEKFNEMFEAGAIPASALSGRS